MVTTNFNPETAENAATPFALAKAEYSICEVLEQLVDDCLSQCGETLEFDEGYCPFCGHHGCFRVWDEPGNEHFHCFSVCDAGGDVIAFVQRFFDLPSPSAALAKLRELPAAPANRPAPKSRRRSKLRAPSAFALSEEVALQIFADAQEYYASNLAKYPEALGYQLELRQHQAEALASLGVGYSDWGLTAHLLAKGHSEGILEASGLCKRGALHRLVDFFPDKVFIYPSRDSLGRVCAFTFKDPTKQKQYQLHSDKWLGDIEFMGEHTLAGNPAQVLIVEGENDLISCIEAGWAEGILATLGSVSHAQLDRLKTKLASKQVVTLFDADAAGDNYREKVWALDLPNLIQIKVGAPFKDVDEALKAGVSLAKILAEGVVAKPPTFPFPVFGETADLVAYQRENGVWAFPALTDIGYGLRLAMLTNDRFRYVIEWKKWIYFDGAIWVEDHGNAELERWAKQLCQLIERELRLLEKATFHNEEERKRALMEHRKAMLAVQSIDRMRKAIEAFRSELGIAIRAEKLDNNDMLLGVANGVVDLRTGQMLTGPAVKDAYITKRCPVAFNPTATCEIFTGLLDFITYSDQAYVDWLQLKFGYELTGSYAEEAIFMAYGPSGGNGKSLLSGIQRYILGDYCTTLPKDVLMRSGAAGNAQGPTPELAKLRGMRVVWATELQRTDKFNDALLKDLSGGDVITARELNSAPVQFKNAGKLNLFGNWRPDIQAGGNSIFRRLRVYPMSRKPEKPDPTLKSRLEQEAEGILAWMVRGSVNYVTNYLEKREKFTAREALPKAVAMETLAYQERTDVVGQFLNDQCVQPAAEAADKERQAYWTKGTELHGAFNDWGRAIREKWVEYMSLQDFYELLRAPGIQERRHAKQGTQFLVRLKTGQDEAVGVTADPSAAKYTL